MDNVRYLLCTPGQIIKIRGNDWTAVKDLEQAVVSTANCKIVDLETMKFTVRTSDGKSWEWKDMIFHDVDPEQIK